MLHIQYHVCLSCVVIASMRAGVPYFLLSFSNTCIVIQDKGIGRWFELDCLQMCSLSEHSFIRKPRSFD